MIVRESINFERGLDPKTSMDVGKSHLDKKVLEETDWAIDIDKHGFIYELIELIRDYQGYPILVLRNKQHESYPYRAISVRGAFGDYQETPEKALEQIKYIIGGQVNPMRESINFERGMDPKQSMGIGRTVDILIAGNAGNASQKAEGFKALVLDPVDDPKVNPGKTIYWVQALQGENKGEKVIVRKFDEPFGKYWGLEWSLALGESVNFERGMDPIRAMDIGMFHFDVEFSGDIEDMEDNERSVAKRWNYKGIKIIHIEGEADGDNSELYINLSDGDYIEFKQKSYNGPFQNPHKEEYAKISIKSLNIKDFDVNDAWIDEISNGSVILATMRMYEDIKNQSLVKDSINFERGLDPYKALNIGREAQAERLKKFIEEHLRWNGARVVINDDGTFSYFCYPGQSVRKYILEAIEDYGEGGKYKVNAIDLTSRGDPDGGEEHEYLISRKKSIKESIDFERGLEPKKSMGIGLTALEKRIIEETDWHEDLDGVLQVSDIIKVILDYMGSPIVILKLQREHFAVGQEPYLGISKFARTDLVETEEIAEHDAKIDIENYYIRERDLKKMNLK